MCLGYGYLLLIHLLNQNYYSIKLNKFYSGIWFSLTLQSFLYAIFTFMKISVYISLFFLFIPIGIILGWIINQFFYNNYSKKIYNNIRKKFNKRHVIERIREFAEKEKRDNDQEEKSFETIGIYIYIYIYIK